MMELIIGTISDNQQQLEVFLKSFESLLLKYGEPHIETYQIIVLENGKKLTIDSALNIQKISQHSKKSIAENRTYLQLYIYQNSSRKSIIWIVDDDLRFINNNKILNYFSYIKKLSKENIDATFGLVSQTPPLPFLSMISMQLRDFNFNLSYFSEARENSSFIDNSNLNLKLMLDNKEFYYDLSHLYSENLNTHYYWTHDKCLTYRESFKIFLEETTQLSKGINVFRKLKFQVTDFGQVGNESIYRGGNTIIFNKELLLIPNYTLEKNSYNRRSDFNWALINKHLFGRKLKEIVLPLEHNRELDNHSFTRDKKKLEADIAGLLFYRIFELLLQGEDHKRIMDFYIKTKKELLQLFESNYRKNLLLIQESTALLADPRKWWHENEYSALLLKNFDMLEQLKKVIEEELSMLEDFSESIFITKEQLCQIELEINQIVKEYECYQH